MKTNTFFHVVYDGPALDNNEMDVRDLSPALFALGEAIEGANRVLNQGRANVSVKVKGSFKTGCFGIDLAIAQGVAQSIVNFMNSDGVVAGANILAYLGFAGVTAAGTTKGVIQVLRWLKARKMESVTIQGNVAVILAEDGDSIEVEKNVVSLLQDYGVRKGLEGAIQAPLQREGIASVAFSAGEGSIEAETISSEDAECFIVPELEDEELPDSSYEAMLRLVSISFQEKNKWRVSDGSNTFYAEVTDADFLGRIDRNEVSFSKDDKIKAVVRVKQIMKGDSIKADYFIDQVIEHISAARQLKLPIK